ncbi:MAG: hypothetical protein A4E28_02734 [Methanocella sp. PtaU1.Bin125]|nr:MAG: hypothetical protein A4E28_02734 [Methanocella sp. PtaU1.Bin125]
MGKKMSERETIEKHQKFLQNEELIDIIKLDSIGTTSQPWSFLKLTCLFSYAYFTYAPIIKKNGYKNMCYVDLFSGTGLDTFEDYGGKKQHLLGSPVLMSTFDRTPFDRCYFFENDGHELLTKRLQLLKEKGKLTSTCKVYSSDCNESIDSLINELRDLDEAHFLLFVDPFSTEIHWSTMDKLLSMRYPHFDMLFNFNSFGINRKTSWEKYLPQFFSDESYKKCLSVPQTKRLDCYKEIYINKLKQYKNVKTLKVIKISSGSGFYYDLIYTTRKENAGYAKGIDHLKSIIEKMTGFDISVTTDSSMRTLDSYFE